MFPASGIPLCAETSDLFARPHPHPFALKEDGKGCHYRNALIAFWLCLLHGTPAILFVRPASLSKSRPRLCAIHLSALSTLSREPASRFVLAGASVERAHLRPNLEVDPANRAKGKKRDTYRVVDRQTSGFLETPLFAE